MMTQRTVPLLLLLALTAACGDDQDPEGAKELWQRIHDEGYRDWQRAPGYEERQPAGSPHSDAVDIYVNEVVRAALSADEALTEWPEGALIVKDGYDGSTLEIVAAMEKRAGRWFWAEWDGHGDSIFSGSPPTCTDCHESGDDFVRAFDLP